MKVKQGPKGVIGQMRSFRDTALSRFVFKVAICQYSIHLKGVGFLPWAWTCSGDKKGNRLYDRIGFAIFGN